MLFEILRHTPPWVWGLLAALLALGLSQLRARRVARERLLVLPLVLMALGLWSTATSFDSALPLAAWGGAFAAGLAAGRRLPLPAGARWDADSARLQLPGSAWPLAVIVAVFALRYAGGVALALHPAWRGLLAVALPLAALYGLIAGGVLGRVLGLVALARATIARHAGPPAA